MIATRNRFDSARRCLAATYNFCPPTMEFPSTSLCLSKFIRLSLLNSQYLYFALRMNLNFLESRYEASCLVVNNSLNSIWVILIQSKLSKVWSYQRQKHLQKNINLFHLSDRNTFNYIFPFNSDEGKKRNSNIKLVPFGLSVSDLFISLRATLSVVLNENATDSQYLKTNNYF